MFAFIRSALSAFPFVRSSTFSSSTRVMDPLCHLTADCQLDGNISTLPEDSKPINTFLGVPYAQPPVGPLRFQPPQPVQLWSGQRSAKEYGAICPQNMKNSAMMHRPIPVPKNIDEDCLFLNVWSPNMNGKLPVMVWIHGGAFTLGFSNMYDGTALASLHDVVVVTINYRLGPFGFMCSGDGVIRGNMGLLDQLEALRFLKRYVSKFGGDPDNITLFGESAGSISIALHLASPLAGGLFHRAICQSGGAAHPGSVWTQQQAARYVSKRCGSKDGKQLTGSEILKILSTKSSSEIVTLLGDGFSPVLDGYFLPDIPHNLYKAGKVHNADVLIGFNSHEGAQFIMALTKGQLVEDVTQAKYLVDRIVKVSFFRGNPNAESIIAAIFDYYLAGIAEDDKEGITAALVDMYGDMLFVAPTYEMVDQLTAAGKRTLLYHFTHRPWYSPYPEELVPGADHGQEITAVFGEAFMGRVAAVKWPEQDRTVSAIIMELWTQFAKTSTPTSSSVPAWPAYTPQSATCLQLDPSPKLTEGARRQAAQFWNTVIAGLAAGNQAMAKY